MRISLTVNAGPHEGRVFEFEGHSNFFVGRSKQAHFRLVDQDKFISRLHFMVEVNPPLCRLTDMGSTNGTLVNDRKVKSADLNDGDVIQAGKTALRVSVAGDDAFSTATETLIPPGHSESVTTPVGSSTDRTAETVHVDARSTIAHVRPEPRRTSGAAASLCRACAVPVQGNECVTDVCPVCGDQIRSQPQSIAGYRIVKELGRGGMGVVYLALREGDGSRVAIKTMKPAVAVTDKDVQRFLREASVLGKLDHPNIVAFREMGESGGVFHFAMDFVDGGDASRLQRAHGGPLPVSRAVGLVRQLLQSLDYAHAKGFVHRDIKPANLLVTDEGGREAVRVTDFGLARVYQTSKMSGLTLKGDLGGTLAFMAPEQITDLRDARPPVDQYSAGATLYKFLTDRYIHDLPARLEQQIQTVLLSDPVPIRSRRPDLPEALASVVHRALARDPAERFEDVGEMRRALAPFGG